MNLIFFTPACVQSSIGGVSAMIIHELVAHGCSVTVVRTEAKHLLLTETHDFGTLVLPWDDDSAVFALIKSADACVYQIGNNFEFHEGGVRWLTDFPGLVCIHDFFLGHLFYGWAQTHRSQADAILQDWYGKDMAQKYFTFSDSESFIEAVHEVMPMTEWICSLADGVITHSRWGCARVMNSCAGPVRIVPLPPDNHIQAIENMTSMDHTLNILALGHVNKNKRIMSVIMAIGGSRLLKQRVKFRLVGAVTSEMRSYLTKLANDLGVNLLISGEVDETTLIEAISESNVISCLRWPILEAASGSVVKSMLYGKAVIVTNAGFYSEIPDSCVIKIDHSNEIAGIQSSLIRFLEDKYLANKLGDEAKKWAAKTFTSKNYAEQVIDTIINISTCAPKKKAVDYFCKTLQQWSCGKNPCFINELTDNLVIFE